MQGVCSVDHLELEGTGAIMIVLLAKDLRKAAHLVKTLTDFANQLSHLQEFACGLLNRSCHQLETLSTPGLDTDALLLT